jgi:Short C-terminal domain
VKKEGAFIGVAGFGLVAAAEGMITAALLNKLTARYDSIQTIIRYQTPDLEAFFYCSTATPSDIRIQLSEPLSRIGAPPPTEVALPAASTDRADLMTQLGRLGELYAQGLLTAEEFAAAKAKLLT